MMATSKIPLHFDGFNADDGTGKLVRVVAVNAWADTQNEAESLELQFEVSGATFTRIFRDSVIAEYRICGHFTTLQTPEQAAQAEANIKSAISTMIS